MKASEIRQQARLTMKTLPGKYQLFALPLALAILSITLTIHETMLTIDGVEIDSSASVFPFLVSLLLTVFLTSASFTLLDVVRRKREHVRFADINLIISHEVFWKFLTTMLLRWLYLLLWGVIWVIGWIMMYFAAMVYLASVDKMSALIILIVGGLISLFGAIMWLVKSYAYSQADYLLYDHLSADTYRNPAQLLRESAQLMKGHKWKLFCLDMSFMGWYLLVAFTSGLAYFYVLPYTTAARTIFYDNVLAQAKHNGSKTKEV